MVKRACDACHIRRTKCGGGQPCTSCQKSGLKCRYVVKPKKRGPRGRIINLLQLQEATVSEDGANGHSDKDAEGLLQVAPQDNDSVPPSSLTLKTRSQIPLTDLTHILEDLIRSASRAPNPLVDSSFSRQRHSKAPIVNLMRPLLATTLDTYVTQIYPLSPIVNVPSVMARFQSNAQLYDPKFAALLLSLCAQATLLPGTTAQADDMVEMAVGLHNTADLGDRPTLEAIATSLSISAYLGARRGPGSCMVKRKEAIALAELMGLDRKETFDQLDETEREIALTLFWKLLVGERSFSLVQSRPLAFVGRVSPLLLSPKTPYTLRLTPITRLFTLVDPALVDCLNGQCCRSRTATSTQDDESGVHQASAQTPGGSCSFTKQRALSVHSSIEQIQSDPHASVVQLADLLVTKTWLQIKLWLASVSHAMLELDSSCPELHLTYPIVKVAGLKNAMDTLQRPAFEANGKCMSIKLSIIAEAVAMVIGLPNCPFPAGSTTETVANTVQAVWELSSSMSGHKWMRYDILA